MTALALAGFLMLMVFSGIPVAFALGATGLIAGYLFQGASALIMVPQVMFGGTNSFLLIAIPLFVLMSEMLNRGGVTEILFETANKWLRHLPGGLAISTVITSAIGASVTGSSLANAATMGIVAIPALLARGYERKFVYGLVAASGTLGILIPPSIPMILIGAITGESVGKMFMAGVVPGILVTLMLIVYVVVVCSRGGGHERLPKASWSERWQQTRKAAWGLVLPPIILGGMYTGAFTPTEAAGVGAIYAWFVGAVVYRRVTLKDLGPILLDTMHTTSMIMLITGGALVLGNVITVMQIPQQVIGLIQDSQLSAIGFLLLLNFLMLILGCLLEVVSITFITVPIVYPILLQLNIDPIWFAVMFVINMEIAQISPPVGLVLYVISGITKGPMEEVIRGVAPFLVLLLAALAIVIAAPELSLWLPAHVS